MYICSCFSLEEAPQKMASKVSYQRLRNEGIEFDDGVVGDRERGIVRVRSWARRYRGVHIKRKMKIKIPSLRMFLRRKARVVVASLAKVAKRLKESQAHFGDLFAGNYLFMQVTPTSLKHLDKSSNTSQFHHFSCRYHLPKLSY